MKSVAMQIKLSITANRRDAMDDIGFTAYCALSQEEGTPGKKLRNERGRYAPCLLSG
jgi:hypothetical protein